MMSLFDDKQADTIDAFNSTSRYLDDTINIKYVYFSNMVSQIYPFRDPTYLSLYLWYRSHVFKLAFVNF